jgi:hypothetical protein
MKNFAKLDSENKIITVNVVNESEAPTEEDGISFLKTLFGEDSEWVQSGIESRGDAIIGETYSVENNLFSSPPMLEGPLDQ